MITMFATLGNLNWQGWFKGMIAAFVGGGAGAVSNGFGNMLVAPDQFNLSHPGKLLESIATSFVVSGVVTMMAYLHQSPVPQERTTITQTVTEGGAVATKIEHVETPGSGS